MTTGMGFRFMRRFPRRFFAALASGLAVAACGRPAARPQGPIEVTDDAGRRIAIARPAQRIVSLAPSSTELLFALGAGAQVVGRTTWCKHPPAAEQVPAVGDGVNPNIEAVAARQPDLVVLYKSALNATAAEQLARLQIPAVILSQDRLADVARDARVLGALTGRAATGDSIAAVLEELVAQPPPPATTKLAFVVWDNPLTVIGAGSFLDELARHAGAANVFADVTTPSAAVSLETLASRDPDVIAVIREDSDSTPLSRRERGLGGEDPAYATRREWQAVRAVRERRFVYLPGSLFGRPSPRAAEAVAAFRQLLRDAAR